MPILHTPSASLFYELDGRPSAPVLLLSNSLGTSLEMWNPQIEPFTRRFRVLRYDMRGHGKSSTPPGPYAIDDLAKDVLALIDGLHLQSVHFCGLSIGGVIGQFLAASAPARLDRIVLANTAAKIGTPAMWDQRIARVQSSGIGAIVDAVLARWFTEAFLAAQPGTVDTMRSMLASTDAAGYAATCAALRDMDQRDLVRTIVRPAASPVCILAGQYDLVTSVADAEALERSIPGSILKLLPAAHISNVEAPSAFNAAVLDFLGTGA